jgi:transaldolase
MKIFLDTAEADLIRKYHATGLVDGVTTNPSLIAKSGRVPDDVYQEIIEIGVKDISMEVMGNSSDMIADGMALHNRFSDIATIKVPCTPDGLAACKYLSDIGIDVNVTLVFSVAQAILSAKAGAKYVSPFVGRINDQAFSGLDLIKGIATVFHKHKVKTQILSASIRDVNSAVKSWEYGADVVTMPAAVLSKMCNHILTDQGLEIFDRDAQSIKR